MSSYLSEIEGQKAIDFINALKGMNGAVDYDGDYSTQVYFELKNGKRLRFGYSDEDGLVFIDQYEGLGIVNQVTGETKFI